MFFLPILVRKAWYFKLFPLLPAPFAQVGWSGKEGREGNVCEEKYNSTVFLKQLKNVFHAGSFQFHNV